MLIEVVLFFYSGYGLWLAFRKGTYLIGPFIILDTLGMGYVAVLGLWQGFQEVTCTPESVMEAKSEMRTAE